MPEPRRPAPLGESQLEVAPLPPPKLSTFASLRNRDYLWFWIGQIAAFSGLHMALIARGWLVWTMTRSAFDIGVVSFAFGIPVLLFSVFGGAIADRMVKRNLLIITQVFQTIIALFIATLITTGMIEFWHLVAAAVFGGFLFVFNGPGRQAIIHELVRKEELLNAIALNSSGVNLTRIAGPALAGALLAFIGIDGVYYIVAACNLAAVAALYMITPSGSTGKSFKLQEVNAKIRSGELVRAMWADLAEGFHYIHHSPVIFSLLIMALIPLTFGLPYTNLLPVFADEVLHVGELGYGTLMTMSGIGALAASLGIASLGNFRKKGVLLIVLALAFGIALALFSMSRYFILSMVLLTAVGAFSSGYMAINNTLLQSNVPRRLLGRVMSIYMLTFAFMPMGALPIGALAEVIGTPIALGAGGMLIIVFTIAMTTLRPGLQRLE